MDLLPQSQANVVILAAFGSLGLVESVTLALLYSIIYSRVLLQPSWYHSLHQQANTDLTCRSTIKRATHHRRVALVSIGNTATTKTSLDIRTATPGTPGVVGRLAIYAAIPATPGLVGATKKRTISSNDVYISYS